MSKHCTQISKTTYYILQPFKTEAQYHKMKDTTWGNMLLKIDFPKLIKSTVPSFNKKYYEELSDHRKKVLEALQRIRKVH